MKFLKFLVLSFSIVILSGCFQQTNKAEYTKMELDSFYLNEHAAEYRNMHEDSSISMFEERYFEGIGYEVEFFVAYIEAIGSELTQTDIDRAISIFDKIYSYSKYEVNETDNGVEVVIHPIDIIVNTFADTDIYSNLYLEAYNDASTEEEVESLYFNYALDILEQNLNSISYLDTISFEFDLIDDNGYFAINEEDLKNINTYIIGY